MTTGGEYSVRQHVVHNLWINLWKAGGSRLKIEIRGAERLSFRERQVVAMKESGAGSEQVAKRLGIAASSVATLFNRARAKGYEVVIVIEGDPLSIYGEDEQGEDEHSL